MNNTSTRRFTRRYGSSLGVLLLVPVLSAQSAPSADLMVTSSVVEGGCTVMAPGDVPLYSAGIQDFLNNNQTAKMTAFAVTLSDCQGGGDGMTPSISVKLGSPTVAVDNSTDIFAAPGSGRAGAVGVALRAERYSGALSGFYVPGQMISTANDLTYPGTQGQQIEAKSYWYTAGLVSTSQQPTTGTVEAKFIFQVVYR